ncbi:hypothetical protein FDECE_8928 [Fusarium decemcellulare]|nr:hypothetical protein FDECE_8928 [Fusarium decemcellulare]
MNSDTELHSELTVIDPRGDLTLLIGDKTHDTSKRFLVSSKVLTLASPVLANLLSPKFKEGTMFHNGKCDTVTLEEDDLETMGLILQILHYQSDKAPLKMAPTKLATFAIHCDKYDLIDAVKPWASQWCRLPDTSYTTVEWGYELLAASMLRLPTFPLIASNAAKHLKPNFSDEFQADERLICLPDAMIGLFPILLPG